MVLSEGVGCCSAARCARSTRAVPGELLPRRTRGDSRRARRGGATRPHRPPSARTRCCCIQRCSSELSRLRGAAPVTPPPPHCHSAQRLVAAAAPQCPHRAPSSSTRSAGAARPVPTPPLLPLRVCSRRRRHARRPGAHAGGAKHGCAGRTADRCARPHLLQFEEQVRGSGAALLEPCSRAWSRDETVRLAAGRELAQHVSGTVAAYALARLTCALLRSPLWPQSLRAMPSRSSTTI